MIAGELVKGQQAAPWLALEGVNAVGKTRLARQAASALGPRCVLVGELPDTPRSRLPGQIIRELHASGDLFLRTGVPRTETVLLAALQVHRHETTTAEPGQVVLEDRGPHTVAVYQSVILAGDDPADSDLVHSAQAILDLISSWRPLPQMVLLLTDDTAACLARFRDRAGRPARPDEAELMRRASHVYELMAGLDPARFQVIDRRVLNEEQCAAAIVAACQATPAARTEGQSR